jgi:hypothetical protein
LADALARTPSAHAAGLTFHEGLVLAGVVVVIAIGYRVSLFLRPFTRCRRCGGSGKARGLLGGWGYCRRCGGEGLVPRLGTVLLAGRRRARAGARSRW